MINLRESKPLFLTLRFLLSVTTITFAIRIFINPSWNINSVFIIFSLGLLFAVQAIEMICLKQTKYFTLTLLTSIFLLFVGFYSLWTYISVN